MRISSVSDFHPGRFGTLGERQNAKALRACADEVVRDRVDLFVANGDTLEEFLVQLKPGSVPPELYRRQRAMMGDMFRLFTQETGKPVTVMRGNHDLKLTTEMLHERFDPDGRGDLSFDLRSELIWQPHPDVLIHHGHLLHGTLAARAKMEQLFASGASGADALDVLNNDASLEQIAEADALDFDGKFIHRVAMMLMRWGALEPIEGLVVPTVLGVAKSIEQGFHEELHHMPWMRRMTRFTKSMTDAMAYLACLAGAKVGLVGHDHQHSIARRNVHDPRDGQVRQVLIANAGDWIGHQRPKAVTLVDTDLRTVSMKRYAPRHGMEPMFPTKRYVA